LIDDPRLHEECPDINVRDDDIAARDEKPAVRTKYELEPL
jgi:hypothetical protein